MRPSRRRRRTETMSNSRRQSDGANQSAASNLAMDCGWVDIRPQHSAEIDSGYDPLERRVGTVTTIEQDDQTSTYSFEGLIRYTVDSIGSIITIHEYSGTGMLLD